MKTYKCFIVDDEPLALNVIEQHLSKFSQFEVCGKSTDPMEALIQIKRLQPDLLFLDIEMPEISGLDLIASIQHKPEIIISTRNVPMGLEINIRPVRSGSSRTLMPGLIDAHTHVMFATVPQLAVLTAEIG